MTSFIRFMENRGEPMRIRLGAARPENASRFIDEVVGETGARPNPFDSRSLFFTDGDGTLVVFSLNHGSAPNSVMIADLHAEPQRTGAGSRLMRRLCDKADAMGVTLELSAVPLKTASRIPKPKLREFYKSFGFKPARGADEMLREPKPRIPE